MKAVNKAEDKETHSAHLPGAEFPPALVGEARNLHQFWWVRHEISTKFGGRGTKSPPVLVGKALKSPPSLVGEALKLHQLWWARHEISTSFGGRGTKSPTAMEIAPKKTSLQVTDTVA